MLAEKVVVFPYVFQYAFSTRMNGDMRNPEVLSTFMKMCSVPLNSVIQMAQVHGRRVTSVSTLDRGKTLPDTDGLFFGGSLEKTESISLVVKTADCVPLLFLNKNNNSIAVAHSGWKGTQVNIAGEIVEKMREISSDLSSVDVLIGPHIGSCCYVVPKPRAVDLASIWGKDSYVVRGGNYYLCLSEIITVQLAREGVKEAQIHRIQECTSCLNDRYFSFRKDAAETFGEQVGILSLSRYNEPDYNN